MDNVLIPVFVLVYLIVVLLILALYWACWWHISGEFGLYKCQPLTSGLRIILVIKVWTWLARSYIFGGWNVSADLYVFMACRSKVLTHCWLCCTSDQQNLTSRIWMQGGRSAQCFRSTLPCKHVNIVENRKWFSRPLMYTEHWARNLSPDIESGVTMTGQVIWDPFSMYME